MRDIEDDTEDDWEETLNYYGLLESYMEDSASPPQTHLDIYEKYKGTPEFEDFDGKIYDPGPKTSLTVESLLTEPTDSIEQMFADKFDSFR